jgi:UDP-N-acetylmuramoylalanine--D-glutamate ligase
VEFQGKNILVLGAGISGISVAVSLNKFGANVVLNDSKPRESINKDFSALETAGIKLILGRQGEDLLEAVDYVVLSPGISIYSQLIVVAMSKGISILSEIEVAYRLCKAPIIAITGTNGKTTTTALLGQMIKAGGCETVVGGNIGLALSNEVADISSNGVVVAEISSFQLEGISKFRPYIAVILNLTPDHLERHHSMENYQQMKERIFANQTADDYLILNYDDPIVRTMAARAASKVLYFSRKDPITNGAFINNDMIIIKWQKQEFKICSVNDLKIKGAHNLENALAATCAAFLAGISNNTLATTLCSFPGVEHRIEPVASINDVDYYNDSKATNPEASIKALEAFVGHIILIAGGRDKHTDLSKFMQLVSKKVDHLILLGEAQERFTKVAQEYGVQKIHHVANYQDAVAYAYKLAQPPQIVLLSPACASYDMFDNYEERGKVFKDLVQALH